MTDERLNENWGAELKAATDSDGTVVGVLQPESDSARCPVVVAKINPVAAGIESLGTPANLPYGVPPGLDWLTDTLNGIDIYRGFVKRPTVFFDPSASSSIGIGTFKNPYTTQLELQYALAGNQAGQVVGIKRGTTLRVTGASGLNFSTTYGAADRPLIFCPYGDAQNLPIITGGEIISAWAIEDSGLNIWAYPLATESDAWQDDVRLWKKIFSGSAVETLTTEGSSTYQSGVLYIRPYNGENPNLGQFEIAVADFAIKISHANVAASGYLHFVGLNVKMSLDTNLRFLPGSTTNIVTCDDISIVGCKCSAAGTDKAGQTAPCCCVIIGNVSDARRITNLYIGGNYATDALNNAYEINGTSGALVEHNIGSQCGGHTVIEMYASNSDVLARYNIGNGASTLGRIYTGFGASGVYFGQRDCDTWAIETSAKNINNTVVFNLIMNCQMRNMTMLDSSAYASGHKFWHNTCYNDQNITRPGTNLAPNGWSVAGTSPNGCIDISNNLFYWKLADGQSSHWMRMCDIFSTLGPNASIPTGDHNIYFSDWLPVVAGWRYGAIDTSNFTVYKSALAGYSLDQNSVAGISYSGSTLTKELLGFNEITFKPLAGAAAGGTGLTGIGSKYQDGTPYVAASCTIGALPGA